MSRDDLPERPLPGFSGERPPSPAELTGSAAPFVRVLLVGALGLSVALLIAAVSARQVSQRGNAEPLLRATVESLTDPEALVASELDTLRARARSVPSEPVSVPGFPIDITLTPEEAATRDASAIAALLVERGAARVYDDGMSALDQTANRDDSLFSAQGIVRRVGDRLTADSHDSANRWSVVLVALTASLGVAVVLAYREDRRLRTLGLGVFGGSLAGLLASLVLGFAASQAGSHDPFVEDVRNIVQEVLKVPRRNFVVGSLLGAAITVASVVLRVTSNLPRSSDEFDEPQDAPY